MAAKLDGGAEIRLSKDEKERLGRFFKAWIERVEETRRNRMTEVWIKCLDNYEGKSPVKQFPWPGASNVFLPVTGTHCDAIASRLYAAATAHTPIFNIKHNRTGTIFDTGVAEMAGMTDAPTWEEVASWFQNISAWIEKNEVVPKEFMDDVILTMVVFGDSYVYLPWEVRTVMDVSLNLDTGKVEKTERPIIDQPFPHVLHPKDVYKDWDEEDIQGAKMVGIGWDLDEETVLERKASGYYGEEDAEELIKLITGKTERDREKMRPYEVKEYGGEFFSRDVYEKEVMKRLNVDDDSGPNRIRMVTVFSRVDADGDGIPEDHIFEVTKETGRVVYARYANYLHLMRPLVHFWYMKRPGSGYNKGVAELLFNLQKIINQTMRDHLDNNKVQNTKMFLARKGSPVEEDAKVYPTRIFFVDDIEADFKSVDLGTGRPVTQVQDIAVIERWAQFITGITDFNLGQEKRSRTPATTTLALLEEGNKRIDRVIDTMRQAMLDLWYQVLMLYFQNGDPEVLVNIAINEAEEREKFLITWDLLQETPNELIAGLFFEAEVSSNALNKSVEQQRALTIFGQIDQFYQRLIMMAQAIGGALLDPVMRNLFLLMVKGYRRSFGMFLDAIEVKDQEILNPKMLEELLQEVTSVEATGQAGATGNVASSPAAVALGNAAGQAGGDQPIQAEGRPGPGAGRSAGDSGAK